eukprot:CAMPEP_0180793384 /NCGR_PEP_ID=MMETSP1038_2-20121128/54964_1 /TAXON_ID=632150 /ORGANISM="Azadinium spinosum, Strain 3D9" /LENGTH=41 /DNA_ID= /DNA_START= /DNA_END= /DNA_ORIENTATION=
MAPAQGPLNWTWPRGLQPTVSEVQPGGQGLSTAFFIWSQFL